MLAAPLPSLPDLPLTLAGVSRPVVELLRASGIPTTALPRITYQAAGCGRFLLFDSQHASSAAFAKRSVKQGFQPIDVVELAADLPQARLLETDPQNGLPAPGWSAAATMFLLRLKERLERLGGLWLRIAPFPFPFQRAVTLAVSHNDVAADSESEIRRTFPKHITHFVPTRLRRNLLLRLKAAGVENLAWHVTPQDLEGPGSKTVAHWRPRLARFAELGWRIQGLVPATDELTLPYTRLLREVGFLYSCHHNLPRVHRLIADGVVREDRSWIRLAGVAAGAPVESSTSERSKSGILSKRRRGLVRTAPTRVYVNQKQPESDVHHRLDEAHVFSDEPVNAADSAADTMILADHDPLLRWVHEEAQTGQPLCILETSDHLDIVQELLNLAATSDRFGLTWQPTCCQLAHWNLSRRRLQLQVWRTNGGTGYEIHADGIYGVEQFGLDIWRGAHRASLPLSAEVLTLRDEGLVFLRDTLGSAVACGLPPPAVPARASAVVTV